MSLRLLSRPDTHADRRELLAKHIWYTCFRTSRSTRSTTQLAPAQNAISILLNCYPGVREFVVAHAPERKTVCMGAELSQTLHDAHHECCYPPSQFGKLHLFLMYTVHAETLFAGFQADNSAAVRVNAGARAGFKDCTFNNNAATEHGSAVGMDNGALRDPPAACWFQSCIFATNDDSQGYAVSQTDGRALHYNNHNFQKSVDVNNNGLIEPEAIDFVNIANMGFLIASAETYTDIASVRPSVPAFRTQLLLQCSDCQERQSCIHMGCPSHCQDHDILCFGSGRVDTPITKAWMLNTSVLQPWMVYQCDVLFLLREPE